MDDNSTQQALEAFANLDFKHYIHIVSEALDQDSEPFLVYLLIICLDNLGRHDLAENYSNWARQQWNAPAIAVRKKNFLIDLCLNAIDFKTIKNEVLDRQQQGQLLLIEGSKHLIHNRFAEAFECFRDCTTLELETLEGNLASKVIAQISRYNYSSQPERNQYVHLYMRCVTNFLEEDHTAFLTHFKEAADIQLRHELEEMLLLTLQKMGYDDMAESTVSHKIRQWRTYYGESWTPALVSRTLGTLDDHTLLQWADNDLKLAEAYYYIAMQALRFNNHETARKTLEECIALAMSRYSVEANLALLWYYKLFKIDSPESYHKQSLDRIASIVSNPGSYSAFYDDQSTNANRGFLFASYNDQVVSPEAIELSQKILEAFLYEDFEKCTDLALQRLRGPMNYWVALMELYSLYKQGKVQVARQKGTRYAEILDNYFGETWYGHLIRLFIGGISPKELFLKADNPTKRLQAYYYVGLILVLEAHYQEAYNAFINSRQEIGEIQTCIETGLIQGALQSVSRYLRTEEKKTIPIEIIQKIKNFPKKFEEISTLTNSDERLIQLTEYLKIWLDFLPNEKTTIGLLLYVIGTIHYNHGNRNQSEEDIRNALNCLTEADIKPSEAIVIDCQVLLAKIQHDNGQHTEAVLLLENLIANAPFHLNTQDDYIVVKETLGLFYSDLAQYVKAVPLLRAVIEARKKMGSESHKDLARAITNEASCQENMGNYTYAKNKYEEALILLEKAVGKNHSSYARVLNYLGKCNKNLGNYREALPLYQNALSIIERIEDKNSPFYSTILNNLGKLYEVLNDYPNTIKLLKTASELTLTGFGKGHPKYAVSLRNLASIYINQGKYSEALSLSLEALSIFEEYYKDGHFEIGREYCILGTIYTVLGDNLQANQFYQKSLKIIEQTLGIMHDFYADTLHSLAINQSSTGNYEEAVCTYREAIQITSQLLGTSHFQTSQLKFELANNLQKIGKKEEALYLLEEVTQAEDQYIDSAFSIASEWQRQQYLQQVMGSYNLFLFLVLQEPIVNQTLLTKAYELVLKRKGILTEYLHTIHFNYLSSGDEQLTSRVEEFNQLKERIFHAGMSSEDSKGNYLEQTDIQRLVRRKDQLEVEISNLIAGASPLIQSLQIDLSQLMDTLDQNVAYIDFVRIKDIYFTNDLLQYGKATYIAFILTPGQSNSIRVVQLGEAALIEPLVKELLSYIKNVKDMDLVESVLMDNGNKLFDLLLKPIIRLIGFKYSWLISPDGMLNLLPFQILPIPNSARLVIDEHQVSYMPVMRDLFQLKKQVTVQTNPPVVISDPDFNYQTPVDQREGFIFNELFGTWEEGKAVAELLQVKPLTREHAKKKTVQSLTSPIILHISTHGFFLEQKTTKAVDGLSNFSKLKYLPNPLLRSGLALAGANTWDRGLPTDASVDNGLITAEEIARIDLRGNQLVVLSACETGLGDVEVGEGVSGMRRSFVVAGAQSLLMSLWSVPDDQTKDLMIIMYRQLADKVPCAEAIRYAQLAIKNLYPHPFFWAAFIYQGKQDQMIDIH